MGVRRCTWCYDMHSQVRSTSSPFAAVMPLLMLFYSSNVCRLSAVGLGWARAFGLADGKDHSDGLINDEKKRWIELDNRGIISPMWSAFEVFGK